MVQSFASYKAFYKLHNSLQNDALKEVFESWKTLVENYRKELREVSTSQDNETNGHVCESKNQVDELNNQQGEPK
jgi:hypothetical protein